MVIVQGQYFIYHAIPAVVVAAAAVCRGLIGRVSAPVWMAVLAITAAATGLTAVNRVWLGDHQRLGAVCGGQSRSVRLPGRRQAVHTGATDSHR